MRFSSVPLPYIWRNLSKRKLTTFFTASGMALVVFVFAAVLMLAEGLRQTLVATGASDNVMVIRKGAQTEVQSGVDRGSAGIVEALPEIATTTSDVQGLAHRAVINLVSKEIVVLNNLPKRETNKPSNVTIRGTTPEGLALRPQVKIIQGRMFRAGTSEIIAGTSIAKGFQGAGLGESLRFAQRDWIVVGVFDAGKTGFDSEIWGDAEQLMQSFRRFGFSSMVFKLSDTNAFAAVKAQLEADPRLQLEAKRETQFYADQSEGLAKFIQYLGVTISIIFSIGAVIGAMVTMYASVANRVGEIGTLRALGFGRSAVLVAFLGEALLLALVGGAIGLLAATFMQNISISTTNFQTFSELAFSFKLTPSIFFSSIVFALAMGFVGGFLPALRASRMKIVDALRAA